MSFYYQNERETGMDICEGSMMAIQYFANIVKLLLDPQGLDKMLKYEKRRSPFNK